MNTKLQTEILSFFNISSLPFLERSKVSYIYDDFESNMSILSSVYYSRQIAAITGASGTGKSSLVFYSENELDPSEFRVVSTELSNPNKKSLYKTIALKLGLKPFFNADDIKNQIITFFNAENAQGKFNCVIIDEIRSFYDEGGNFSLILSGLPSLLNMLNLSVNVPLKQRISLFIDCSGLSLIQTKEYISHQLDLAKCKSQIFDEKCFPLIHSMTSGAPRKINQFCYCALLQGYKLKSSVITEDILKLVEEKLSYGKQKL